MIKTTVVVVVVVPSFFLANVALSAIHEVVHAARDVMGWLQRVSRIVSAMKKEEIEKYYNSNEKIKSNLLYAIREEKTFQKLKENLKIS